MNKIISLELLNKIANYLAKQPWIEANELITAISQLKDEEKKEEKK